MDLTQTTAPKSDQQNFDDYISGPKTVTISEVRQGSAEQPVEIHLVEFPGRPYKPNKSMRRVLIAAWGPESTTYAGRRMTLAGDPTVRFGGAVVGGIKISHLSNIDKRLSVNLTVTRGKRAPHTVEPLPDAPTPTEQGDGITRVQLANLGDAFKAAGITDRDMRLDYCVNLIARNIESAKDLTKAEASRVIDALAQDAQPEPGFE